MFLVMELCQWVDASRPLFDYGNGSVGLWLKLWHQEGSRSRNRAPCIHSSRIPHLQQQKWDVSTRPCTQMYNLSWDSGAAPNKNRPLKTLLFCTFQLLVSSHHSLIRLTCFWWYRFLKWNTFGVLSWMISYAWFCLMPPFWCLFLLLSSRVLDSFLDCNLH